MIRRLRPSKSSPDLDELFGNKASKTEKKRRRRQRQRRLKLELLEERALLAGFELLSIQPNAQELLNQGDVRNIGFNELTFRFSEGTRLDPATLADGIHFVRGGANHLVGDGDDVVITPNFFGLGDTDSEVVVRFAETLPDDLYQIQIFGTGATPLRDIDGNTFDAVSITPQVDDLFRDFELNLGAQVIAVVPQPIERDPGTRVLSQAKNKIIVYFNDDDLKDGITSAENPAFYQLILTHDTVRNTDDVVYNPMSVNYDPLTDQAELTFATDLDQLFDPLSAGSERTYRLRIGTAEVIPDPPDPPTQVVGSTLYDLEADAVGAPRDEAGSSFDYAYSVGALGAKSMLYDASIDTRSFPLEFPGANDEPGHREVPVESHLLDGADISPGVEEFEYNFAPTIIDPDDSTNVLQNLINEEQKQRAREVFEIYSHYLGVQFIETETRGLTIATGDLRFLDPLVDTGPLGVIGLAGDVNGVSIAIMDAAEAWDDGFGFANAAGKQSWFVTAMHEIGHLLGLGHSYDLPPGTVMGDESILAFGQDTEPVFPGDADIVHGQHLHRPESNDIDMYQFSVAQTGLFSVETFAERLPNSSLLDTNLILYDADGNVLARNNDYYSEDSFIELELDPGTYYVGVSSTGNENYDPDVADSGFGGTSQGLYELRLNFRPDVNNSIVDLGGTLNLSDPQAAPAAFDGDADGVPGGVYNFWFRTQDDADGAGSQSAAHTIFVDKSFSGVSDGSIDAPYSNIATALADAQAKTAADGQGVIVRIVGNEQGESYQIGRVGATPLDDGAALEVPKNVTVMIDAGAIFKLLESRIGVGSSSANVDRNKGALQVLGTPEDSVFFTSFHDDTLGEVTSPFEDPSPGDWGGLRFRNDFDNTANRFSYEDQGIFLNYVNHADLRWGGGDVPIGSVRPVVAPISMIEARPTVSFNRITHSADAAMGADPDSFKESNFHAPRDQQAGRFTADYSRVGPDIHGNLVTKNSLNGLYVRIATPAGGELRQMTVSGRFDDTDIVHIVNENLVIAGTPGGAILDEVVPPVTLVVLTPGAGGQLADGTYNYRITFVDALGNETPASVPTGGATVNAGGFGSITLTKLPTASGQFVARRIYRSNSAGGGIYRLVDQIPGNGTTYVDTGGPLGGELEDNPVRNLRARQDASLVIDPDTIVKLANSRIEVGIGANLIAEGLLGREVVFTSLADDSYGRGGTSDTRSDGTLSTPAPGDWGGIHARQVSSLSIDRSVFNYGGGVTSIGGTAAAFNVIEVHQADARITRSVFQHNADGQGGQAASDRVGRGFNDSSVIFVRGAQPVIADNLIVDNGGAAISINANALNADYVRDRGRQRGAAARVSGFQDNQGALVGGNVLGNNDVNGMRVRAQTLTTEVVWDDTDIVHVVDEMIHVPDFHTYGGLRLESRSNESLVVKFTDSEAGLTATGRPLDIDDRIGGGLQVIGQPGRPVVLTSLLDDTVGAGFDPQGNPQLDTNNDGLPGQQNEFLQLPSPGIPFTVTPSLVGQDLLDAMLLRPLAPGVTISAADLVSAGDAAGVYDGGDSVPLQIPLSGAILTTGDAKLPATNTDPGFTGVVGTPPDPDLDALIAASGFTTTEATSLTLTIDVAPGSGIRSGSFLFQFGSDEFSEFVGSPFNDVLGGFVNGGAATNFLHDSLGNLISVNSALFDIDNEASPTLNIEYDGMTIGLLAEFPLVEGTNTVKIAVGDASDTVLDSGILMTDLRFSTRDVGAGGVVGAAPPSAGDWAGVIIDQYAGDRNVDVAVESEVLTADAPGTNATTDNAQFIGAIAPAEYEGDENLRLGFDVHGYLNGESDVDIYSFDADVGTEVWFDIDHTTSTLDSIIEVLDGDGNVIATSNDSEKLDQTIQLPGTQVNGLGKSDFYRIDNFTVNPRDAGMRVVLPGAVGDTDTYFVRVKSDGKTEGGYKLQLRLRETQEVPGSTVRYGDVRYAATGIQVLGQPLHSPLLGETGDVESNGGDNETNAQALGNLLNSDRGAINIAGAMSDWTDVDFYDFDVRYDSTQGTSTSALSTIIDVNYAAGAAGPNTTLALFNAVGQLIYVATDSNVADDLPGPLEGADIDDLLRGSVGNQDPLLGAVDLPEGKYFLAISNSTSRIQELEQFLTQDPVNPLLRLAPIETSNLVVDDPAMDVFLNQDNIVPFNLGDVTLFVSQDQDTNNSGRLFTVDPFTGQLETVVVNNFGRDIGDIEIRNDGTLVSFSNQLPPPAPINDANTSNYISIDTGTGAVSTLGDDGITTWFRTGTPPNFGAQQANVGILFDAMAFREISGRTQQLYAVGHRRDASQSPPGVESLRNILYLFDPDTGAATSLPAQDRPNPNNSIPLYTGAGTQIRERGVIVTSGAEATVPNVTDQNPLSLTQDFRDPFDTLSTVLDGLQVTFADSSGNDVTYELDLGASGVVRVDPSTAAEDGLGQRTLQDGDFFDIDGNLVQFDTGWVVDVERFLPTLTGVVNEVADGDTIQITALGQVTLELDSNGLRSTPGSILVPFTPGVTTKLSLVGQIVSQVNSFGAGFGVSAQTLPGTGRITLSGATNVVISAASDGGLFLASAGGAAPIIAAPAGNFSVISPEGQGFTLNDGATGVDANFEFDTDGVVTDGVEQQSLQVAGGAFDEQQTLQIVGPNNGSTFQLVFSLADGSVITTGNVADNANNAAVQTAVDNAFLTSPLVPGYAAGDLLVTGTPLGGLTFDYTISLGAQDHNEVSITNPSAGQTTLPPVTVQDGGPAVTSEVQNFRINNGQGFNEEQSLTITPAGSFTSSERQLANITPGTPTPTDEAQRLQILNTTGGDFTLTVNLATGQSVTTAAIQWDASAMDVQDAINNAMDGGIVPGYVDDELVVTGANINTAPGLTFTYTGSLGGFDHPNLTFTPNFVGTPAPTFTPVNDGDGNELQKVSITGTISGTFTLTVNLASGQSVPIAGLPWDADAATVQTAINTAMVGMVPGYRADELLVSRNAVNTGAGLTFSYTGSLAGLDHPDLMVDTSGLLGFPNPINVTVLQDGMGDAVTLTFNLAGGVTVSTAPFTADASPAIVQQFVDDAILSVIPEYNPGDLAVSSPTANVLAFDYGGVLEGQNHDLMTVSVTPPTTALPPIAQIEGAGNTFDIDFHLSDGTLVSASSIPFNVTQGYMQAIVDAAMSGVVPGYTPGDLIVTGTDVTSGFDFEYAGSLGGQDHSPLTAAASWTLNVAVGQINDGEGDTFTITLNLAGLTPITTDPIVFNAPAAQVEALIDQAIIASGQVPTYTPGDIAVTGLTANDFPAGLTLTYNGSLAGLDHGLLSITTTPVVGSPSATTTPVVDGTQNTIDLTFHFFDATSITIPDIPTDALWTDVQTVVDTALTGFVPGYTAGDLLVGRGRVNSGLTFDYGGVSLQNQNHGQLTVTSSFDTGTPLPTISTILNATTAISAGGFQLEGPFAANILSQINRTANANRDFGVFGRYEASAPGSGATGSFILGGTSPVTFTPTGGLSPADMFRRVLVVENPVPHQIVINETDDAATIADRIATQISFLSTPPPGTPPLAVPTTSSAGARFALQEATSLDFSGVSQFNEHQFIDPAPLVTSGTFDLTFAITRRALPPRIITVQDIPYDATTVEIQAAIDAAFREVRDPLTAYPGNLDSGLTGYLRGDIRVGGNLQSGITLFYDGTSVAGLDHPNVGITLTAPVAPPTVTSLVDGGEELIYHERDAGDGTTAGLSKFGPNNPPVPGPQQPILLPIDADMSGAQLANLIVNGILATGVFGLNITLPSIMSSSTGNTIEFSSGTFTAEPVTAAPVLLPNGVPYVHPFTDTSTGSGGNITGLVVQPDSGNRMFAVDDAGGFYEVHNYRGPGTVTSTYMGIIDDPTTGQPIHFAGLTYGPQSVENGAYANSLFAISNSGVLYAIDPPDVGVIPSDPNDLLLPIFLYGAKRAEIPLPGTGQITGLDFSTLDTNLWHVTPLLPYLASATEMDERLGLLNPLGNPIVAGNAIVVNEQQGVPGHTGSGPLASSFHFGQGNYNGQARTYDFPGGAHGAIESETFSLKGYAAADQPYLYFDYYAERGSLNFGDSFRVYASTPGSEWTLVASNDGGGQSLFDYDPSIPDTSQFWRQARIPLADYAGQEGIRLRFEFSTAGDYNLGDDTFVEKLTTGTELRAPTGAELRDGQIFTVSTLYNGSGATDFEFDLGYTLLAPSGVAIDDGDQFVIDGVTFQFDDGSGPAVPGGQIPVMFNDNSSPRQVAQSIVSAISVSPLAGTVIPHLEENRVNLEGALNVPIPASLPVDFVEGSAGRAEGYTLRVPNGMDLDGIAADGDQFNIDGVVFEFDNGTGAPVGSGIIPIPYDVTSTAEQIAETITAAIRGSSLAGTVTVHLVEDAVNLEGAVSVTVSSFDLLDKLPASFIETGAGYMSDFLIPVHAGMTSDEVARLIAERMETAFSGGGTLPTPATQTIVEGSPTNDTRANAFDSGIRGGGLGAYSFEGEIGDNPNVPSPLLDLGSDVDLVRVELNAGITINVAANATSGGLDPLLRVFDSNGVELNSDDNSGLGQNAALTFQAPSTGVYYIGVSSAPNDNYLTNIEGSGNGDSTGQYELTIDFNNPVFAASKLYNDVIQVIGRDVIVPGPLTYRQDLPGDPPDIADTFSDPRGGQSNEGEGIYVDDIKIGFAERGEQVNNATIGNTTYVHPLLEPIGEITDGSYQVEIRRGPDSALVASSDTNDRYVNNVTLIAPPGYDLVDGGTFRVGDGLNEVVFEFNDTTLPSSSPDFGITPGHFEIPFIPSDPDYIIARRIRTAINSPATQNVIKVTASLSDGDVSADVSTSNRVNLYGLEKTDIRRLTVLGATTDADTLVEELLGNSPQITFTPGVGNATLPFVGGESAGFFTGGESVIGIDKGIILSTGSVFDAEGPNNNDSTTGLASEEGDPVLDAEFGVPTADTTALQFTFDVSTAGDLSFQYVFASEEYNEYANTGFNDVFGFFLDGNNIALIPDTPTPISINTVNGGNPFGFDPKNPGFYVNNDPNDGGGPYLPQIGYDGFTTLLTALAPNVQPGTHTIRLTISDVLDTAFDSAVFLKAGSFKIGASEEKPTGIPGIRYQEKGDQNRFRDQGQVIISSTSVTDSENYGIVLDAGQRSRPDLVPLAGDMPHQGTPLNPTIDNLERWAPGAVVLNSIIARNGAGGVHIAGDPNVTGDALAAVSFARLINNTLYGLNDDDIGIDVSINASPTLLNNIVANFTTGIQVDASSSTTVVQGTAYQLNGTNTTGVTGAGGLGDFFIDLDPEDPLFVNPDANNFIPAPESRIIDSSVAKVDERDERLGQLSLMGIGVSPLLAPELDSSGQVRTDDPDMNPPSGSGFDPFKDRGAVDRADFTGPTAVLRVPADNDPTVDLDLAPNQVNVGFSIPVSYFAIQLVDGVDPNNPLDGSGIADVSVVTSRVKVFRVDQNGQQLLFDGVDYNFTYDATNNTIRLTSTAGLWAPGAYVVLLDNSLDQKTIDAPDGSVIVNGETIAITDKLNNTATLEFVSGLNITVPAASLPLLPGQTFTLSDGVTSETFEFTTTGFFTPGNIPVDISPTPLTEDIVGAAIVDAIKTTTLTGFTPLHLGGGFVHLGGGPQSTITAPATLVVGGNTTPMTPGAIAVPYIPGSIFSSQQSAAAIAAALGSAGLVNVPVSVSGSQVLLLNVASIVSNGYSGDLLAISDRTGNELLPNNTTNNTTTFSIVLGIPDSDFGDAPDPYPTQISEGGAYHAVAQVNPLHLGALIDVEPNGLDQGTDNNQGDNATGDADEDGVSVSGLFATGNATFTVVSSGAGKLDAWIDFDQSGSWDPSEQIFISKDVSAGTNLLSLSVPNVPEGDYWARFRLSTDGGLAPTGGANDGEVEDYLFHVGPPSPFQNPNPSQDPNDVNADGLVNFADILTLITDLRANGFRPVPEPNPPTFPPPYLDPNGDNLINFLDVLSVLSYLRNGGSPEGEGGSQPEGEPSSAIAATTTDAGLTTTLRQSTVQETTTVEQTMLQQTTVVSADVVLAPPPTTTSSFSTTSLTTDPASLSLQSASQTTLSGDSSSRQVISPTSSSSLLTSATTDDLKSALATSSFDASASFDSLQDDLADDESDTQYVQATAATRIEDEDDLLDDTDPWDEEFESALDEIADDVTDGWNSQEAVDSVFSDLSAEFVGRLDNEDNG